MKEFIRRRLNPTQIIVLSFAAVIAIGTALLSLPFATRSGTRMPLVDAFFTAVSATCVTGLIVEDTGTHFSIFGQMVILACIQTGGLGLMTLTSIFAVAMGSRLAIAERIAVQESYSHSPTVNIRTLVKYIVIGSLFIEFLGAALLTIRWHLQGRFSTFSEAVYSAVFHSVSAFCNAGFSLFKDSLTDFHEDPITIAAMSFLIIIGGLGFLVGMDVKEYFKQRYWPARWRLRPVLAEQRRQRLSLHTKFVLITSFSLLVIGTVSYYFLERNGAFADMPTGIAWLNAYFGSVTARTAGFNTFDYGGISGAAALCTMVLMFIGASPGSTGGGVKTSTFGLLVAFSISRWRGHTHLNAFGRTVPQISIDRAAGVVIAGVVLLILSSSVLMATETFYMSSRNSQSSFLSISFEAVSAFATVGLSMGQTATIGTASKIMIAVVMFLGRIGPITLALAISRRQRYAHFRYAEENIMIG